MVKEPERTNELKKGGIATGTTLKERISELLESAGERELDLIYRILKNMI